MNPAPDRFLFVGGPGRSGTSHVAKQLGQHPEIASFPDVELKLVSEKSGLLDLHHSLVEQYSPNRASVAVQQFRRLAQALLSGQYGQPALSTLVDDQAWTSAIERFLGKLSPDGHPMPMTDDAFSVHASWLLRQIAALAASRLDEPANRQLFLEKTPHSLLAADFIERMLPGSQYLHVMRDPRAIAYSLRRMRWGPDNLKTCCAWVRSYCKTLRARLACPGAAFPSIRQVRIEDLVQDPENGSRQLTTWLDIAPRSDMFAGASAAVLGAWKVTCSDSEQELLNVELAELARSFGYEADDIAARPSAETTLSPAAFSGQ